LRQDTATLELAVESRAPDGTPYRIPTGAELAASFRSIEHAAHAHRANGGQVVVVQGLGFVGAAVAATLADVRGDDGEPLHFVIGVDLAIPSSYWKIAKIREGSTPVDSADPDLARLTREGVERGNLHATSSELAYALADTILIDVHLDVENRTVDRPEQIAVRTDGLSAAVRTVGRHMRDDALVLVETTVPVGACERWIGPLLEQERARRGIETPLRLAHAYERVMPGPRYVESIRSYPRTFAGTTPDAASLARGFLAGMMGGAEPPLWELSDTTSSELAKLLENSYRAANIAFIHEWTLLAEEIGVNLFDIVDSVRVRSGTHDNMRYPGFGVGGYCLTKDSLLAQWGAMHLLGAASVLETTLAALRTNFAMPLHTFEHARSLADDDLDGRTIAVCGIAYVPTVADTRNAPAEVLVDALVEAGATVRIHDPRTPTWPERPGHEVLDDLRAALEGADGVIIAVPHDEYGRLSGEELSAALDGLRFVVDAQNALSDETAAGLHAAGCRVSGVGKGHWRRRGYAVPR
jgi:UDP-N-acetyl-D-glucosamine dehydrogenase